MGHHHSHSHGGHDHGGPTPERALWVALGLNATFLIIEAVVGFWTNSLALLSDAGHMVSDVSALVIALIALRLASRKPFGRYTFGLRRAPVIGGLLNGMSLIVIVVLIGIEAVERLREPPSMDATAVFWTGLVGLFVNLVSAWYLARSRDESVNTRGAMLHLLSDALGSVAAIVSAVAIGMFGLTIADPVASIVIALLILVGSLPLLRDTFGILLQRAPSNTDVQAIKEVLLAHAGVKSVSDFHLWGLDDGQPILSAVLTVTVTELEDATLLSDALRADIHERFGIDHATLECRHDSSALNHVGC